MDALSGNIAFIAVPAEEAQPAEYYAEFLREGRLRATSGKAQLILEGVFDDVTSAMLIHASSAHGIAAGYNGLLAQQFTFHGKAAHAGLAPEDGINALSMLRCTMAMIDAQRENQNPADHIRIHGIITQGGLAENIIPEKTLLSLLVRAKTLDALKKTAAMTERCAQGAALAFEGEVSIATTPGYLPLRQSATLAAIHKANLERIAPGISITDLPHRGSSTDMGDISSIMPAIHPNSAGASGTPHGSDFIITDPEAAYISSAKLLAMNTIDLLYGNNENGRALAAEKSILTREAYCQRWK
jgi:metal-dependent amidase/aminoacylase/carboxypeptidase family protein